MVTTVHGLVVPTIGDTDTLTAALRYAECGWHVLPIAPGGKHAGSRVGVGWPAKSSRDPRQIAAWFAGSADGLALHVGRSGGLVFDVDAPDALPDVLTRHLHIAPYQSTRGDEPARGHYVFAAPPGRILGNGKGALSGGWGEVRGSNGIIVAAPSAHAEPGGRYRWIRSGPVPELPAELAAMLPDSSPADAAATDAAVRSFLAEHTGTAKPELLSAVLAGFTRAIRAGESRHDAAVTAACWAMRESAAGYYPAADASDRLRAAFLDAVAQLRPGSGRVAGDPLAATEWSGILARAIGQARATDPARIREQVAASTNGGPVKMGPTARRTRAGRPELHVGSAAIAAEWLRENIGRGYLAGMFNRDDTIVYTPQEGEEGYIPLTDDGSDGPAQIRSITRDRLAAIIQYTYYCYREKQKTDLLGGNVVTVREASMFLDQRQGCLWKCPISCRTCACCVVSCIPHSCARTGRSCTSPDTTTPLNYCTCPSRVSSCPT